MKISKLDLTSFKSFAGESLDLRAPRTFIAGLNGAGKTSLREAIRYALTGKAQSVAGNGAGVENLIPTFGGDTVAVSAWIDGLGSVTRSWFKGTSSLEVQGFNGSPTEQQAALYEKLGTSEAFLQAVLDTSVFLHLHHAEAKALVLAMLNVEVIVTTPSTEAGLTDASQTSYTLDQLDAAYAKAFEDRKAAKQKVKGAFLPPKPTVPTTSTDLRSIDERLTELRGLLTKEREAIAVVSGQSQVLQRQLAAVPKPSDLPSVPEDVDAQIESIEERLALMEADAVPQNEAEQARPAPTGGDPTRIRQLAEKLKAFDPKDGCVLDGGIRCPVAKLKFTNRGKDLLETIPAPVAPVAQKTPAVGPMTLLRGELDALKSAKNNYQMAVDTNAKSVEDERTIREQLSALPDLSEAQGRIAKAEESIQKGEVIKATAQAYLAAVSAFDQAHQHKTTLDAEVVRLEALVTLLGPSGARVQALQDALGRFETTVNASLTAFGWTVAFTVDPWGVVVNGRPVETYSRSEQHRIGIALQIAIAELSGLGFAVVDELDMLDAKNRETMGVVLLRSPLDQVIILGTRETDSPLPKGSVALTAYRIANQDGRSVIVERSAA